MDFVERNLKTIIQALLLAVIAIVPFIKIDALYFPFVSGKAYIFRALIAVAFFFWIWLLLKNSKSEARNSKPFLSFRNILLVAIVMFFLAQIGAAFFGVDPLYSLFSSIERADGVIQYGFWLLYFLMFLSVFREKRDWNLFFGTFIAVAVLLSGYSWINHESQPQLYGIFGNPAYFAAFLLFAIGFSFLVLERRYIQHPLTNYVLLGTVAFLLVTLIFTQVRGVYVGLAGGIFLFCLLAVLFLRKEQKKLAFASGIVLLVGVISLAVLFAAKDTEFVQNTRLLYRITEVTDFWESGSVRERVLNWNIALKAFKERPIFGYGPENFGSAANKYYDYRIGASEPWFDRAHNQPLDTLATGGVVVFSAYLFWLLVTGFLIFKIAKKEKVLGFLLASLFLAYFLQGFFLFDLLAVYLGLFPFLAFLIYQSYELRMDTNIRIDDRGKNQELKGGQTINYPPTGDLPKGDKIQNTRYILLIPAALFSLFVVYTTAIVPYKANAEAIQFFTYTEQGYYEQSKPFVDEAFRINSPYTSWEVRKRAGWQFSNVLEYEIKEDTEREKVQAIQDLYDGMTLELEKFIDARPYDPQMYYVLARTYRLGSQKLGRDDLGKAEATLRKGFDYSNLRVEYFNEFARILLLEGKFEEAEQSVRDYVARVRFQEYFPYVTLGHFYFVAEKYEQAFEQYEKAREAGYSFVDVVPEYSRYLFVAEKTESYEKVVDMAKAYLARWGSDADTYFNIAVGYLNLGDTEAAKEFFLKAVELNPAYEEKQGFFLDE